MIINIFFILFTICVLGKGFMQAQKIFHPGKIFFMQAIKEIIVYTSTFCSLCKPLD